MLEGKYNGKYFSVLGDSVSTFEGFTEPDYAVFYMFGQKIASDVLSYPDTWCGRVINALGGKLLVNNSFSGSTVTWSPSYEIQSYACSDERTSSLDKGGVLPDVIMVFMGINDWGMGRPPVNSGAGEDLTVFPDAYSEMLEKLKNNYFDADIWCFTLPISRFSAKKDFVYPYEYGGIHISKYCDAIRDCAKRSGCKLIDLFANAEPYDTTDGMHPNKEGMLAIADGVLKSL